MKRIAIITTTINEGEGLLEWADSVEASELVEAELFVALDQKVHGGIPRVTHDARDRGLKTHLLWPNDQAVWSCSAPIGWKSIQRRNIALLEVLQRSDDFDYVLTVDDDNVPVNKNTFFSELLFGFEPTAAPTLSSETGWWNPGQMVNPLVHHRGYPLDERHRELAKPQDKPQLAYYPWDHETAVVAGLWTGDPDIDATERISKLPDVRFIGYKSQAGANPYPNVRLAPGTWSPFNTQSTTYDIRIAPLMQVLSGVGRYDDIWMSYVARRIMDEIGVCVNYGRPLVHQERNEHDLVVDLEKEMHGYRNTPRLCDLLRGMKLQGDTVVGMLDEVYTKLETYDDIVPRWTQLVNRAWLADLEQIGY